jgi:hypothetical protein
MAKRKAKKKRDPNQQRKGRVLTLQVDDDLLDRAEALVGRVELPPEMCLHGGRENRSSILRAAIDLGLTALEKGLKKGGRKKK